ncbi:hypothetical protein NP493_1338g00010 [Ridgeia piscesae]|uniref:Uncharacterized protein n=1 Tax=Ridgeia piscesae TaxID=27915 RepID=A0AAD9NG98_RIDPI|nr:hypothetical protein NP493_1338g00010 [Ridgeia piscesae]
MQYVKGLGNIRLMNVSVPVCANAGVWDKATKACNCARGWTGKLCTRECKDYHAYCNGNPGWPKRLCTKSYVWRKCPAMCGVCDTVCKLVCSSGVLNKDTCSCNCTQEYMGKDCSSKCADKSKHCDTDYWPKSLCSDRHPDVLKACPMMCGQCVTCETWPKLAVNCSEFMPSGYDPPLRKDRADGYGGVMIAIKTVPHCEHGSVLNPATKTCTCTKGWTGPDCNRECKDNDFKCDANPGWPKEFCTRESVRRKCPVMCGICVPECKLRCANSGVLNEETCSCNCLQGWAGNDCSTKCEDMSEQCTPRYWPKSWCNKRHQYVLDRCPMMCGVCGDQDMPLYDWVDRSRLQSWCPSQCHFGDAVLEHSQNMP